MMSAEQLNQTMNECLCEFKEVAEFDKSCISKVNDLVAKQKHLHNAIALLEKREKASIKKLEQADCMWTCMEKAYKDKIEQANERQKLLLTKLNDIEANNSHWKKIKADLQLQLRNVQDGEKEMAEKIAQKQNDLKTLKAEIENLNKRIEDGKKETQTIQDSFAVKKMNAEAQINKIAEQITEKNKAIAEEIQAKAVNEKEGNQLIREAREDLQKSWKVLLQKRLENEDLKVEKETLLNDIKMLETIDSECVAKCQDREKEIAQEIKDIDMKIKNFQVRCTHCHRGVDTEDARYHCNDCPRCARGRECLKDGDTCVRDPAYECVCMTTKRRFMDNVFENMFIVLERYIQTNAGKAVGKVVLDCLKNSRNGKLDKGTRKILQDFILTTVKKNLNLTIVGGAIKTRCEMDPETFKELMLCVREVKVTEPITEDKATAKKPPCKRWESTGGECNCKYGPKGCVCCTRAPPLPRADDPDPFKPDDDADIPRCPENDRKCGPDCGMHGIVTGEKLASWRPDPCKGNTCNVANKNMNAAHCILGGKDEYKPQAAPEPMPSTSIKDAFEPRESIIKELLGKFTDVDPIDRIKSLSLNTSEENEIAVVNEISSFPKTDNGIIKSVNNYNIITNNSNRNAQLKKDDVIINLSFTPSGQYVINMEDSVIKDIKAKLGNIPNMNVSLKKVDESKFLLDFQNHDKNLPKIILGRTESDKLILKAPKKVINPKNSENPTKSSEKLTKSFETLNKGKPVFQQDKQVNNKGISAFKSGKVKPIEKKDIRSKVIPLSKETERDARLKPIFFSKCTETHSCPGTASTKMSPLSVVPTNVCPVSITTSKMNASTVTPTKLYPAKVVKSKINSDRVSSNDKSQYMKKLLSKSTEMSPDFSGNDLKTTMPFETLAHIKKTNSGHFKLCLEDLTLELASKPGHEEFYPVKVKRQEDVIEPPLILMRTSSNKFLIVVDKEYNLLCQKFIEKVLKRTDYVKIQRSSSGKFVFNLDEITDCNVEKHIIMTRTPNRSANTSLTSLTANEEFQMSVNSANFEKIYPAEVLNALTDVKHVDTYKTALKNHKKIMLASTLTKIRDGKYAVNLDQSSKDKFLENIKILFGYSQAQVPVIKSTPGEIVIELQYKSEGKLNKELFQITNTGSIYLIKRDEISTESNLVADAVTSSSVLEPGNEKNICNDKCDARKCYCKESVTSESPLRKTCLVREDSMKINNEKDSRRKISFSNQTSLIKLNDKALFDALQSLDDTREDNIKEPRKMMCYETDISTELEHMPPQLPPFLAGQWDLCGCKYKSTA